MGAKAKRIAKNYKRMMLNKTKAEKEKAEKAAEPVFTLFPNLPIELRLKIWGCTFEGKRYIVVHAHSKGVKHGSKVLSFTTSTRLPFGAFRACKESRDVAIKALPFRLPVLNGNVPIRFSKHDVICVENLRRITGIVMAHYGRATVPLGGWAENVTNMIATWDGFVDLHGQDVVFTGRTLTLFPNLQNLGLLPLTPQDMSKGWMRYCEDDSLVSMTRRNSTGRVIPNSAVLQGGKILFKVSHEDLGPILAADVNAIRVLRDVFERYMQDELTHWKMGWKMPNWNLLALKVPLEALHQCINRGV